MYLIDANVLIEAKNRYYGFDIAPGFWEWLIWAHDHDVACSIEPVREELRNGNDELADWAEGNSGFFRAIDSGTTRHFTDLSHWVSSRQYTQAAIAGFLGDSVDYLLVAYAREHEHVVVTHERPQPMAQRRVLIPDACAAMGVSTTDTFRMLRSTGTRLTLGHPPHVGNSHSDIRSRSREAGGPRSELE